MMEVLSFAAVKTVVYGAGTWFSKNRIFHGLMTHPFPFLENEYTVREFVLPTSEASKLKTSALHFGID
eukprot:Gb_28334 [translate_table: standard]